MSAIAWQTVLMSAICGIAAANTVLLLRSNKQLRERLDRVERKLSVAYRKRTDESAARVKSLVLRDARITARKEYQLSEAYLSLVSAIQPREPLPATRGWAASPDLLKYLYTSVRRRKPAKIVELGGGVSTLVIAYALAKNGMGKLISVDHSPDYSAKTKEQLELHQLSSWVEHVVAPIGPLPDHDSTQWYDCESLVSLGGIDMLLVDGPPADTGPRARYPAVPVFKESLTREALVLLDDGIRDDERDIAEQWGRLLGTSAEYLPLEKGLFIFDLA